MSDLVQPPSFHPADEKRAVHAAAEWLAKLDLDMRPRPIVPALRAKFELDAPEAIQAIREAGLIQARAH